MKILLPAIVALLCNPPAFAADKLTCEQMIALADSGKLGLKDAILADCPNDSLKIGNQFLFHGGDFFFAIESDDQPSLIIDQDSPRTMKRLEDTKV